MNSVYKGVSMFMIIGGFSGFFVDDLGVVFVFYCDIFGVFVVDM